jgi:hypothetical protein
MNAMTNFMKNMALLGAALAMGAAVEGSPKSNALEQVKKTDWRVLAA